MTKTTAQHFVVCIDNDGYPASLELRKIYVSLADAGAAEKGMLRVIDESGDDYLYPTSLFLEIALPSNVSKAVLAAA